MGFAYPRLRAKHSALAAAILLGAIHVTWHLAGMTWAPPALAARIGCLISWHFAQP